MVYYTYVFQKTILPYLHTISVRYAFFKYLYTWGMCCFSLEPLRGYNTETITLELPGDLTIFNIDWFSVFDISTQQNLGSIIIPDGLNVPPSLIKVIVSSQFPKPSA